MTVIRLRDVNPTIESTASNLRFRLGSTSNDGVYHYSSVSLDNVRSRFDSNDGGSNMTTTFFKMLQTADGVALCAAESLFPELQSDTFQANISLRTRVDIEKARVDATGLWATSFQADEYNGLVNDYFTSTLTTPPSASALNAAYVDLSNLVQTFIGSNAVFYPPSMADVALVDTYMSTSLIDAPTAHALNTAYVDLSNETGLNYHRLSNLIPAVVYTATLEAVTRLNGDEFTMQNNAWIKSVPDNEPRLRFDAAQDTVFAAPGTFTGNGSFKWFVNDLQQTVASLSGEGDLWAKGSLEVGGGAHVDSLTSVNDISASTFHVGGVPITSAGGSNVGIGLGGTVSPQYALHVNGLVYSDEGVYAMSDMNQKSEITMLEGSLEKLRKIHGYSYMVRNRRRLGVLAQEVANVAPEAIIVSETEPFSMGVCHADVLALVVESIHDLYNMINDIKCSSESV